MLLTKASSPPSLLPTDWSAAGSGSSDSVCTHIGAISSCRAFSVWCSLRMTFPGFQEVCLCVFVRGFLCFNNVTPACSSLHCTVKSSGSWIFPSFLFIHAHTRSGDRTCGAHMSQGFRQQWKMETLNTDYPDVYLMPQSAEKHYHRTQINTKNTTMFIICLFIYLFKSSF